MKKTQKALSVLLVLLITISLCACGGKGSTLVPVEPVNGGTQTSATTPAAAATEPQKAQPQDPTPFYDEFLNNKSKVYVAEDFDCYKKGESFTLDGLCESCFEYVLSEWLEFTSYDIECAFIDCGLDDVPELVVRQNFYYDNYSDMTELFIIKYIDGKLTLIAGFNSFYRTYTDINYAGYIQSGGSSGAANYAFDHYYINADGELVFLYNESYNMALPKAVIPSYDLPSDLRPEDYDDGIYSGDWPEETDWCTCATYNFERYKYDGDFDAESDAYEKYYNEYCKHNFFTLTNEGGSDMVPELELSALYKKMGVEVLKDADAQARIQAHIAELGCTDEIKNCEEDPEYTLVEYYTAGLVGAVANADGTITADTVEALLESVNDGATIILKPGKYYLSDWLRRSGSTYYGGSNICTVYEGAHEAVKNIFVFEDQIIINRVKNLTIKSEDPAHPAEIILDSELYNVLSFCECNGVVLENLVAGHGAGFEGFCSADVFEFAECADIKVNNCDLYGCGAYGIIASDSNFISVNGGVIHDCSYGCAELYNSSSVSFTDVSFRDCKNGYGMFYAFSTDLSFSACDFKRLSDNLFVFTDSYAYLYDCSFDAEAQAALESASGLGQFIYVK